MVLYEAGAMPISVTAVVSSTAVAVAARGDGALVKRFLRDGLLRDGLLRALRRLGAEVTTIEAVERSRLDPDASFEQRTIVLAQLSQARVLVEVEVGIELDADTEQLVATMTLLDMETGERQLVRALPLGAVTERGAIRNQARPTRVTIDIRGAFARNDLLGPASVPSGEIGGTVAYSWQVLHDSIGVDVVVTARIVASFAYRFGLDELTYTRFADAEPTEDVELVSLFRQLTPGQARLNGSEFELGGGYRLELGDRISVLVRGVVPMRHAFGGVVTADVETASFERFHLGHWRWCGSNGGVFAESTPGVERDRLPIRPSYRGYDGWRPATIASSRLRRARSWHKPMSS